MLRPGASDESVRGRMSRQRRTGTAPEIALRRELHRRGLRFVRVSAWSRLLEDDWEDLGAFVEN